MTFERFADVQTIPMTSPFVLTHRIVTRDIFRSRLPRERITHIESPSIIRMYNNIIFNVYYRFNAEPIFSYSSRNEFLEVKGQTSRNIYIIYIINKHI